MSRNLSPQPSPFTARWRTLGILFVLLLALAAICARSVQLAWSERVFLQGQGDQRSIRTLPLDAYRGVIYDRFGEPLAVSTPVYSAWVNPQHWPPDVAAERLQGVAELLDMRVADLRRRIESGADRHFLYLRRQLTPTLARQLKEEVARNELSGIDLQKNYRRYYPAGEITAHVVGITDLEERGQEGIELAYDAALSGTPGEKKILKDEPGRIVRELGIIKPVADGQDIALALDLRVQHIVYRELKAAVRSWQAQAGSVVVLSARTGEVLSLVNQPSYNPNRWDQRTPERVRNRAIVDVYEPGSTAKPFTVAAALESGVFDKESLVDTSPGYISVGGKLIEDPLNRGEITLQQILAKSSQVGATRLALALPEDSVLSLLRRVGFGSPVGIGFPGEAQGLIPDGVVVRPIERATVAYGYGFAVSPLQLAQAYLVLANDGYALPASLLKTASTLHATFDATEENRSKRLGVEILPDGIAREVVAMLETVVTKTGTAPLARVDGYRVAGKTGTVEKIGADGYDVDRNIAYFAGVVPADNPELVIVVMIDEARGERTGGGTVAAPVFSRVASQALRILRIPPSKSVYDERLVAANGGWL